MIQILNFENLKFQVLNNPRNPFVEPLWNPQGNTNYEDASLLHHPWQPAQKQSPVQLPVLANTQNFKQDCAPRIRDYM